MWLQIRNLKHGDVYRGSIVKGAKTGLGQFEYGNGDVYEGQFEADSMHGYGVYTFASSGLYQGQVHPPITLLLLYMLCYCWRWLPF